jgi:hypothetical protein
MKKLLISSVFCLSGFVSIAQFKLGLQAGASITNPNLSSIPSSSNLSGITFLQPGIIFDFTILDKFSIKPSLNFLKSGYSLTNVVAGITTNSLVDINNLHIPIDISMPVKLGNGQLLFSAGPSITYALSGTTKTSISSVPTLISAINFGSAINELKNFNYGANFGLGYALKNGIELKANYNLGLNDQSNSSASNYQTNILSLLLAYYLIK